MVYNGGNVKMRMHAWVEGFEKKDLSILISAAAVEVQTKRERKLKGLGFFKSLNPLWKKSFGTWLCRIYFFILMCVRAYVCDPIHHGLYFLQNSLKKQQMLT